MKNSDYVVVGGADPGSTGTIWLIKKSKWIMPCIRFSEFQRKQNKWLMVSEALSIFLRIYTPKLFLLEHVHDLPGDRGDVLAEFMQNTGRLKMLLELCGAEYKSITPAVWQVKAGVGGTSHKKPGMTEAQVRSARKAKHVAQTKRILEANNIKTTEPINQETADGLLLAILAYNEAYPDEPFKIPSDTTVRSGTGVVRTARKFR